MTALVLNCQVGKFDPSVEQWLDARELLLLLLFDGVLGCLPHLGCVATSQKT